MEQSPASPGAFAAAAPNCLIVTIICRDEQGMPARLALMAQRRSWPVSRLDYRSQDSGLARVELRLDASALRGVRVQQQLSTIVGVLDVRIHPDPPPEGDCL